MEKAQTTIEDVKELRSQLSQYHMEFDETRDIFRYNFDLQHKRNIKSHDGYTFVCFDGQLNIEFWVAQFVIFFDDVGVPEKDKFAWISYFLTGTAELVWEELQEGDKLEVNPQFILSP